MRNIPNMLMHFGTLTYFLEHCNKLGLYSQLMTIYDTATLNTVLVPCSDHCICERKMRRWDKEAFTITKIVTLYFTVRLANLSSKVCFYWTYVLHQHPYSMQISWDDWFSVSLIWDEHTHIYIHAPYNNTHTQYHDITKYFCIWQGIKTLLARQNFLKILSFTHFFCYFICR